jgi:hypothetical protein
MYTVTLNTKEMTHMDANAREYAGAVAGMAAVYGPQQPLAVGDFVSGLTAGRRWSGHIEWFSDDGKTMVVNVDHSWVTVPVADITH